GIGRTSGLHIPGDGWDLLPTSLRDDDAPWLKLFAESRVVFISWPQRGERFVEMLVTKISHQRAVDVVICGIDVPGLRHGPRIDLTRHQILPERDVRRGVYVDGRLRVWRGVVLAGAWS